jgi:hypothetical protein
MWQKGQQGLEIVLSQSFLCLWGAGLRIIENLIDNVRVYSRVRLAAEIQRLYLMGR